MTNLPTLSFQELPTFTRNIKTLLMQIFNDLAVLVEAQGEMLDNIETQVWWRVLVTDILLFSRTVQQKNYSHHTYCKIHVVLTCDVSAQVAGAVEHIQTGTNHLQKAKKLQKNTRKWTCIAIIILLIIVLIVILSLKPWTWGNNK